VFNGADCIPQDGTINTVSINFCKAPTSSEGKIELYVIKPIPNNATLFKIDKTPKSISNLKKSSGEQKFKTQNILVQKGNYLGFHFAKDAGSPFITSGDSYVCKYPSSSGSSQDAKNYHDEQSKGHKFLYYTGQGITASFTIKYTRSAGDKTKPRFCPSTTVNSEDTGGPPITVSNERSHQTKHSYYRKRVDYFFHCV
jgi:hypothetical protein